jgi:DNA modification methylase
VLCADVLEGLAAIRPGSAQCVVTSPPYYGLRSYSGVPPRAWGGDPEHAHEWSEVGVLDSRGLQIGRASSPDARGQERGAFCRCGAWLGCLGLEPAPDLYLAHLVEVFRAVRGVLRDDGVLWLNIGDSYANDTKWGGATGGKHVDGLHGGDSTIGRGRRETGLKPGDRIGIPERLVLALRDDGWYWRQTVIWSKVNPLPESVSGWRWERCRVKVGDGERSATQWGQAAGEQAVGFHGHCAPSWAPCPGCPKCEPNGGLVLRRGSWRPTTAHEYLYMLTKSADYFGDGDGEAVREPHASGEWWNRPMYNIKGNEDRGDKGQPPHSANPSGRNPRSVWEIPSEPFPDAHFATFPRRLVEPCILSSTPAAGSCSECGAPWAPMVEVEGRRGYDYNRANRSGCDRLVAGRNASEHAPSITRSTHRPTCSCSAPARPALVLDPFAGSGTVGLVSLQHGRRFLGIERSPAYCAMARSRMGSVHQPTATRRHRAILQKPPQMPEITGPLFDR